MKLYIFRHGETNTNKLKILQGRKDIPLNDTGIDQACILRDKLNSLNLPVIFSSPLSRARKTAEIVAEPNNCKIVVMDDLQEADFGDAEGMSGDIFFAQNKSLFGNADFGTPEFMTERNPNGESREDVLNRWLKALKYIKENCPGDLAGVATHGGMLGVIYTWYYNEYRYRFDNCECIMIEVD